jgi:hypothetical protein
LLSEPTFFKKKTKKTSFVAYLATRIQGDAMAEPLTQDFDPLDLG